MLGKIFGIFCLNAIVFAAICGTGEAVGSAVLDGASGAIRVSVALAGMMCFWGGVMNVLKQSGAIGRLAKILKPILRPFFPNAFEKEGGGGEEIAACVGANLLGLGNAATPLALRAMQKLQENNPDRERASGEEITLAVLNTASVTLLPSTLLALRNSAGSQKPFSVLFPIWAVSFSSALFALLLTKFLSKRAKRKNDLLTRMSKYGKNCEKSAEKAEFCDRVCKMRGKGPRRTHEGG